MENEREAQSWPKRRRMTYLLAAVIFLAVIAFNLLGTGGYPAPRFAFEGEEAFVLKDSAGSVIRVTYEEIYSVTYAEDWAPGETVDGKTVAHIREGIWANEAAGRYRASLDERIPSAVVMETARETYVLNYESAATTRAIYEAIAERLEGR